jgi:DNA-binding response OmpR family regulator
MPLNEGLGQRILVVDDDPFVLELVSTRLALAGYKPFTARDGHEALGRLEDIRPAAMILDINMPRLDGFGVLASMQGAGWTDRTATMILTARNQGDDVQRAISLGARDYLSKPFRDEQLLARVARLVRRRPSAPPTPDNTLEI